jgi:hypothetical protein
MLALEDTVWYLQQKRSSRRAATLLYHVLPLQGNFEEQLVR